MVVALVALGGLVTIVEWAHRGGELPGGGMPVTGRVIQEEPGFSGSLAIVEVAYDAGGKERVQPANWNSDTPNSPIPGWMLALGAAGLMAALSARALKSWRRERDLNPR